MTGEAIEHYNKVNGLTRSEWEEKCFSCNDCSRCKMALHKDLFSTTKHMCIYGMSFEKYQQEIDQCEAYY